MTFLILCAVHIAYGAILAYISKERMFSEGQVLGWPLVWGLTPVALISFPVGALLARYVPAWFFSFVSLTEHHIFYERFNLGILLFVGIAVTLSTLLGLFFSIAAVTRGYAKLGLLPVGLALFVTLLSIFIKGHSFLYPAPNAFLLVHPAGYCSIFITVFLGIGFYGSRKYFSKASDELV